MTGTSEFRQEGFRSKPRAHKTRRSSQKRLFAMPQPFPCIEMAFAYGTQSADLGLQRQFQSVRIGSISPISLPILFPNISNERSRSGASFELLFARIYMGIIILLSIVYIRTKIVDIAKSAHCSRAYPRAFPPLFTLLGTRLGPDASLKLSYTPKCTS